jgi:hypothetical protein
LKKNIDLTDLFIDNTFKFIKSDIKLVKGIRWKINFFFEIVQKKSNIAVKQSFSMHYSKKHNPYYGDIETRDSYNCDDFDKKLNSKSNFVYIDKECLLIHAFLKKLMYDILLIKENLKFYDKFKTFYSSVFSDYRVTNELTTKNVTIRKILKISKKKLNTEKFLSFKNKEFLENFSKYESIFSQFIKIVQSNNNIIDVNVLKISLHLRKNYMSLNFFDFNFESNIPNIEIYTIRYELIDLLIYLNYYKKLDTFILKMEKGVLS